MFAVKGWSVDAASLKPQTEAVAGKKHGDREHKQGKKRKREDGQAQQNEDVGSLWDQHIEGKEPVKNKDRKKKERERKRQKSEKKAAAAQDGSEQQHAGTRDSQEEWGGVERKKTVVSEVDTKGLKDVTTKKKDKRKHGDEEERPQDAVGKQAAKDAAQKAPPPVPPLPAAAKLTPMQAAMRQKLVSARFRHLNQTLYTAPSNTALGLFDQNPEMFEDYHAGFRQQVSIWPENPLDNFIATLRSRGAIKPPKFKDKKGRGESNGEGAGRLEALPRTHGTAIIADLGCGDARLAQTFKSSGDSTKLNLKIQSYDLHSPSPLVTKADISNLPLADGSVDIAIFCLALMGTNWISFIEEAYRILHWKGELWVSEIKSRFGRVGRAGKVVEHSVGSKRKQAALQKAQEAKQRDDVEIDEHAVLRTQVDGQETKKEETDVSAFVDVLRRRGFVLKDGERSIDLSNKMFVKMEFIKAAAPTKGKGKPAAEDAKGGARLMHTKKKFVDEVAAEEVPTDDEAKVLKPCLYKVR